MPTQLSARMNRLLRLLLAGGFLAVLGWQISWHSILLDANAPYEAWDEVATYNSARVLSGPNTYLIYRYGTLDTLIQIVANQYYLLFDPLGAESHHWTYSNNNYASLNDEFFVFDRLKPDQFSYSYFRGIDDHRPILIARRIHFAVCYLLLAVAGCAFVALLGLEAVRLLLPMLCLSMNAEAVLEVAQALPNGITLLFSFVIVALIGLAVAQRRPRLLVAVAVMLALAMNFKIDVVTLGLPLGLALIWCGVGQGVWRMIRGGLVAFGAFALTWVATKPEMLIDPATQWQRLAPPVAASTQGLLATFTGNLLLWARAVKIEMLPIAWQRIVPTIVLPALLLCAAAAIVFALWRQRGALLRLTIPVLAIALLSLPPVLLAGDFYDRYALNGIAALYAVLGLALLALFREAGRFGRVLGAGFVLLLLGQYGVMAADGVFSAEIVTVRASVVMWGVGNAGYDATQSRNLIESSAVNTYIYGGYDKTVLVDQHAYLDLRPLRLAGLVPVYVNIENLDTVLAGLGKTAPHLLIYSPGSYGTGGDWWRPWMRTWPAELQQRYDAYLARLAGYKVLDDSRGPAQRLLWAGPVDHQDRMVLAAVPIPPDEAVAKPADSR